MQRVFHCSVSCDVASGSRLATATPFSIWNAAACRKKTGMGLHCFYVLFDVFVGSFKFEVLKFKQDHWSSEIIQWTKTIVFETMSTFPGKTLHWPCIFSSQRYWRRQMHWYFTPWWNQWQMTSALFSSGGIARCMCSNFSWATAMYTTNIPVNQKPSTIMKQKRIDWLTKSCCCVSNMTPFCKKYVMYLLLYIYICVCSQRTRHCHSDTFCVGSTWMRDKTQFYHMFMFDGFFCSRIDRIHSIATPC